MELTEPGGGVRSYEDGEVIFEEGDEGHHLYIVLRGSVLIRKQGELFETFLDTIREDPEFSVRVISSLGGRLRHTTEQLQRVCGEHVRDRAEMALVQKAVLEVEIS
jgi:CRP-like cAMP-binding protein